MQIGLVNLPLNTYVELKNMSEFIEKFYVTYPSITKVSKEIGIPRTLLPKLKRGSKKKIRLEYLLRIGKHLNKQGVEDFLPENLERKIYSLSCCHGDRITNPRLPFSLDSPEAAKALTFPLTDGCITKDRTGYIRLSYINCDKELHADIIRCIEKTFGVVKYSTRKIPGAFETIFTGILGKIYVECLDFSIGNKLKNKPNLSIDFLKSREQLFSALAQVVDDEGYFRNETLYIGISGGEIPKKDLPIVLRKFKTIKIQDRYMPNLLRDIRNLFKKTGISCTVRKPCKYFDKTIERWKLMWYLLIQGPKNLLQIYFLCPLVRRSLKQGLRNYASRWGKLLLDLNKIQKSKGFFTNENINQILKISKHSANNYTKTLLRYQLAAQKSKDKYFLIEDPRNFISEDFLSDSLISSQI